MKQIIPILLIISTIAFASCRKCKQCTVTVVDFKHDVAIDSTVHIIEKCGSHAKNETREANRTDSTYQLSKTVCD